MNNAIFAFDRPQNEPVYKYKAGSPEREKLIDELTRLSSAPAEIPLIIGGKEIRTGKTGSVVMPQTHPNVIAT